LNFSDIKIYYLIFKIRAARVGIDKLIIPSDEAVQKAYSTARSGGFFFYF